MTLSLDRSSWQKVKFGDVVRNVNDNLKDPSSAGIKRVLGLEHLDPGELRIQRWGDVSQESTFTRRVRPGQTLFGKRRAYQRKTAYAEFDAVCSGDILVFESADPARLLPELLPFIAMTDAFYGMALETSAGSLSPRTRWPDIAKYEFELPPLDQQRRIADLLWSTDRHRAALEVSRRSVAGLVDAHVSRFFRERAGHDSVALAELCVKLTVGVVVKPTQYYADTGVPALRSLNIRPGGFVLDDLVYFSQEAHSQLPKSTLAVDDVVIVRTGRPGEAAVVDSVVAGSNAIDLIIARPGSSLNPHFLCRFLNSATGRAASLRGSAGTAQQHFNVGSLAKVHIPRTPMDEQVALVAQLEGMDATARALKNEIAVAEALRKSLLFELLGAA